MSKQYSQISQDQEARMARFGLSVAAGLNAQCEQLPADIGERLRFAREQAMLKAKAARLAQPELVQQAVAVPQGDKLALQDGPGGKPSRWLKLASLGPLLLLVLGLLLIQHSQWYQQILAAAEVDTALLSTQLPPAAYSDPGFREYLNEDQQPATEQPE